MGLPLLFQRDAARQLEAVKAEIEGERERWEHQEAIAIEDLRTLREKIVPQEKTVRRLTERRATYASRGDAGLFGKETKKLDEELAAETAKNKTHLPGISCSPHFLLQTRTRVLNDDLGDTFRD